MHRLLLMLKQRMCSHSFALHELKMVNPEGADDRVAWPCEKCRKEFRAHCGLDISPKHGPTFQRESTAKDPSHG